MLLSRELQLQMPAPYSAVLFAEWFPKLEKVKKEIKKRNTLNLNFKNTTN